MYLHKPVCFIRYFIYMLEFKNHKFVLLFTTISAAESRNPHTDISCICTLFFMMPGGAGVLAAGGTRITPEPLAPPDSESPFESDTTSTVSDTGPNFTCVEQSTTLGSKVLVRPIESGCRPSTF